SAKLKKYLFLSNFPVEKRYLGVHLYDIRERDRLYSKAFQKTLNGFHPFDPVEPIWRRTQGWDGLSRLLYLDTKAWLPNDILIKADRMSMAASIELRVPFLDYRLVEYAATIPSRLKLKGSRTKHVLKQAVRDLVPPTILQRGKMGFPTPLAWMFQHHLAP